MTVDISTLMDLRRRMGLPVGTNDDPDNNTLGVRMLLGDKGAAEADPLAAAAPQLGADAAAGPTAAPPLRPAPARAPSQSDNPVDSAIGWARDRFDDAKDYVSGEVKGLKADAVGKLLDFGTDHSQIAAKIANGLQPTSQDAKPSVKGNMDGSPTTSDITPEQLHAVMPNATNKNIEKYLPLINNAMRKHNINTKEKKSAFLSQVGAETGELKDMEENLNYTVKNIRDNFGNYFPTDKSARPFAHNPQKLANNRYAQRGDLTPNDGWIFHGRGPLMTTHRAKYREMGFENNPEALLDPNVSWDAAAAMWDRDGYNERSAKTLSESDLYAGISRRINGGNHKREVRWELYQNGLNNLK